MKTQKREQTVKQVTDSVVEELKSSGELTTERAMTLVKKEVKVRKGWGWCQSTVCQHPPSSLCCPAFRPLVRSECTHARRSGCWSQLSTGPLGRPRCSTFPGGARGRPDWHAQALLQERGGRHGIRVAQARQEGEGGALRAVLITFS